MTTVTLNDNAMWNAGSFKNPLVSIDSHGQTIAYTAVIQANGFSLREAGGFGYETYDADYASFLNLPYDGPHVLEVVNLDNHIRVTLQQDTGGPFTANSVDLDDARVGSVSSALLIKFTGTTTANTSVTQTFQLDGSHGFQTFHFNSDFANLTTLFMDTATTLSPADTFLFDNFVLTTNTPTDPPKILFGTAGPDSLAGGSGDDIIVGNGGNDTLSGNDGNDRINGGDGADIIFGGNGNDELGGGTGDDIIVGNDGNDTIFGEDGNDQANGGAGADIMLGGAGNDTFGGGADNDVIVGDSGADLLFGEDGNDSINGGAGDDGIIGGAGDDQLGGGDGNDIVLGQDGNDVMFGEAGNDSMNGGFGNDIIQGGDGDDNLGGGPGNDAVFGSFGNDVLFGENGDDLLSGDAGNDILVGGGNSDTFVFVPGDGADTIVDFAAGGPDDRIWFAGTNLRSYAEVQSHMTYNPAANATTITYNGGNTVTINGVSPSQLVAADFIVG